MKIIKSVSMLNLLALIMAATQVFAASFSDFTQISGYEGLVYKPSEDEKPAIVYADMDGDKIDEMVVAMQMQSFDDPSDQNYDEEHDRSGLSGTFAYVYRTDGKRNPTVLLHTIHLGDLLGVSIDDDHEKIIETADLNNDGKKAVALWSTRGAHYHGLVIIGMRDGRVVSLFNGGSGNQLIYEPRKNKNIITAGDIDDSVGLSDADDRGDMDGRGKEDVLRDAHMWREDVWEWNGSNFVYSKKRSSLASVPSG